MAEWSKAVDLSSILFVGVGSNPTSGIVFNFSMLRESMNIAVFRDGVVGNITACHAVAPGSIPGRGVTQCIYMYIHNRKKNKF